MSLRALRAVICCSALTIFSAGTLAGEYQRTKDGKTLIWNDKPKPGDVAGWTGARDRNGYATGFGTLTWYAVRQQAGKGARQTVYARYFGNMVRGKLDGPVNGHANGATSHAVFEDGKLITRWAGGPVPSWRVDRRLVRAAPAAPPAPAPQRTPEAVTGPTVAVYSANTKPAPVSPPSPSSPPATGQPPAPNFETLNEQSTAGPELEAPAEGPIAPPEPADSANTAPAPVTAPSPSTAVPSPERPVPNLNTVREQSMPAPRVEAPAKGPSPPPEPADSANTKPARVTAPPPSIEVSSPERPAPNLDTVREQSTPAPRVEAPTERPSSPQPAAKPPSPTGAQAQAAESAETPAQASSPAEPPAEGPSPTGVQETSSPPAAEPTAEDMKPESESVESLASPPAALRDNSGEPVAAEPKSQSNLPRPATGHLSKKEVIESAEAEARKRGYDLSKYEHSDPIYDPADSTWSLFFAERVDQQTVRGRKRFSVAVDDETKKTAIVPGR